LRRNWEVTGGLQFSIGFSFHCRLGSAKTGSPYITGKAPKHAEGFWRKISALLVLGMNLNMKPLVSRSNSYHDSAMPKSLMLFGSVARDEAQTDSDVDLLVEFDRPVGLFTFVRLKRYLEEILESSVDLGTPDSLKPYLREPVFREAIRAF
jgi:predicted nucleotidyltransferase